MPLPPIILASSSPRRLELLRQLGVEFQVIHSDAKELTQEQLTVRELAQLNAHRKARAVAKKHPDALVIGADTLVSIDGKTLGKPANVDEACAMLRLLQGRVHHVETGVCLTQLRVHRESLFSVRSEVKFRPLNEDAIEKYIQLVNPLDKAGAYAVQEHKGLVVEEVFGSYSNVVGLPIERLSEELERWRNGETRPPFAISLDS